MAPVTISIISLVVILLDVSSDVHAQSFCGDFKNDSTLPQLDSQFSFRVEANFVEHGRTMIVHELYDSVNNRGSIYDRYNGTASRLIFDYDDDEIFFLSGDRPDQTCYVQSFSDSPRFISTTFGLSNINGSLRIGTASGYLLQVQNPPPPTKFVGYEMVRGISVARYQACFDRFNSTYYADYYFSNSSWNYAGPFNMAPYNMIPILVTVQGNSTERDGSIEQFYHDYSIFDYRSGPDSVRDHHLQVPMGQVCRGRIPGTSVPSVPNSFSTTFQYSITSDSSPTRVTSVRVSCWGSARLSFLLCVFLLHPVSCFTFLQRAVEWPIVKHSAFVC